MQQSLQTLSDGKAKVVVFSLLALATVSVSNSCAGDQANDASKVQQERARMHAQMKDIAKDASTVDTANAETAKKVIHKISTLSKTMPSDTPPEAQQKFIKEAQLLERIQAQASSFNTSPEFLHSKDDIKHNIETLDSVEGTLDQLMAIRGHSEILALKKQQFAIYKQQQIWYAKNWGNWHWDKATSNLTANVSQAELKEYNNTCDELNRVLQRCAAVTKQNGKKLAEDASQ